MRLLEEFIEQKANWEFARIGDILNYIPETTIDENSTVINHEENTIIVLLKTGETLENLINKQEYIVDREGCHESKGETIKEGLLRNNIEINDIEKIFILNKYGYCSEPHNLTIKCYFN